MFFLSLYGLITAKKITKSIICIVLLESAVIMFFLSIGFSHDIAPPIGEFPPETAQVQEVAEISETAENENVADPLPQALMITAIVIGAAVTAVNITMLISLYRKHGVADWDAVKKKSRESNI